MGFLIQTLFTLTLLLVLSACATDGRSDVKVTPPPVTREAPVLDLLHGVEVSDPYRWLEDQSAPEVRQWITRQNEFTDSLLQQVPERDALRALGKKLFEIESVGVPVEAGGRYFFTKRRPDQDLAVLYIRHGLEGEDRVLLDPHTLSADHTVSVQMQDLSADGKVLIYSVRQGGADETEIRLFDVDKGADISDGLPHGLYIGMAMKPDGTGFYYATFGEEGPRLRYHAIGGDPSSDPIVFGDDAQVQELVLPVVSDDGKWLLVNVLDGTSGPTRIHVKNIEEDGPFHTVINDGKSRSTASMAGDHLLITTDLDAPNRRVMKADLKEPGVRFWKELIPESERLVIEQAVGMGGKVLVSYMENVQSKIAVYDMEGEKQRNVEFPTIGSAGLGWGRWNSAEFFLTFTSFHIPTTIYRSDVDRGSLEVWAKMDIPIDTERFEVKQVHYTSGDGTRVPMFIILKKDTALDGDNPALLTGYGGFSMSLTPFFSQMTAAWVQLGGVFAVANLRGGGEYGETWHEAGMLQNKQNVFDDFAAACEFLVEEGYTSSDRLAVVGGSNGGLLTGALLVQRPELVGAVICTYPLLDMIRFHDLLMGRYWVAEYGCSEDPAQFEYLYKYSPYHNVKKGERYPATLFVTGDLDTRVDPCHARKMAAIVQARNGSKNPILLRYHIRAGHAEAPPIYEVIDDFVDEMSFLKWTVGLDVGAGTRK